MPATSQEPLRTNRASARISNRRLWSTKEGVGETSGQTAGSSFAEFAPGKPVRQKKQVFFVRCGSVVRNFIGLQSRKVKSAPDVFADALVRSASAAAAWQSCSRIIHMQSAIHGCWAGGIAAPRRMAPTGGDRMRAASERRGGAGRARGWLSFGETAG
jgi:hypothetical protein